MIPPFSLAEAVEALDCMADSVQWLAHHVPIPAMIGAEKGSNVLYLALCARSSPLPVGGNILELFVVSETPILW